LNGSRAPARAIVVNRESRHLRHSQKTRREPAEGCEAVKVQRSSALADFKAPSYEVATRARDELIAQANRTSGEMRVHALQKAQRTAEAIEEAEHLAAALGCDVNLMFGIFGVPGADIKAIDPVSKELILHNGRRVATRVTGRAEWAGGND
jgi:hypothetical protein